MSEFKHTLKRFAESTSVKGVGRVLKTQRIYLKLIWFLAVVFGLGFALYNIITLLIRYFEYQTIKSFSTCAECQPSFPDVTLCNLNSLSISLSDYEWEGEQPWTFSDYNKIVKIFIQSGLLKTALEKVLQRKIGDPEWAQIEGSSASLGAYFQNFQRQDAEKMRIQLESNFIQHCSFYDWDMNANHDVNCSSAAKTIKAILNPQYLWCYTFQPPNEGTFTRGIQAILYLDNFGYAQMPVFRPNLQFSQASGVKVVVHPHGTLPDINKGFIIGAGQQVDIRISATNIKRMSEPYGSCTDQNNLDEQFKQQQEQYSYTQQSCLSVCYQHQVMKKCSCMAGKFAITSSMWQNQEVPFCYKADIKKSEDPLLFAKMEENFQNVVKMLNNTVCYQLLDTSLINCSCLPKCEEIDYHAVLFQTPWPHKGYELAFYNWLIKNNPKLHKHFLVYDTINDLLQSNFSKGRQLLDQTSLIRENFLQLNVYFSETGMQNETERAAVTGDTLFGSIGGNFNLWIGISFFTIIELLELACDILALCFNSSKDIKHIKVVPKETTF